MKRLLLCLSLCCLCASVPAADSADDNIRTMIASLADSDAEVQRSLLSGIVQSLLGRRRAPQPPEWAGVAAKLKDSSNPKVRFYVLYLSAVFGDAEAVVALRRTLDDGAAAFAERRSALKVLLHVRVPGLAAGLQRLLADQALRPLAVRALADYDDAATPAALLAAYPSLTVAEKRDAVSTLVSRPAFAKALAEAVRAKRVPAREVTASALRQLLLFKDPGLDALVAELGGGPEAHAQAEVKRLEKEFTREVVAKGDPAKGRALFDRTCAQCHALFGTGGNVGPDLTGLNRPDLDWVFQNVIDPSAVMGKEQQLVVIRCVDGRIVAGIQREDAADYLTVQNESAQVTVPRAEIAAIEPTGRSTMPDGLLRPFTADELRDFLAYLQGSAQVEPANP
jgi:putative heme-binding domain-containing protein